MQTIQSIYTLEEYKSHEPNIEVDEVVVLSSASVVWADYELIKADFPYVGNNHDDIDKWLLHHCAVFSKSQLGNSLDTSVRSYSAYRPPRYGRAVIKCTSESPLFDGDRDSHLFDLKGVGVHSREMPGEYVHNNGLLHLPWAFKEILSQFIVEKVLSSKDILVAGLPNYALINTGISSAPPKSELLGSRVFNSPTATSILVRRSHLRARNNNELPEAGSAPQKVQLYIELILRCLGITSASNSTRLTLQYPKDKDGVVVKYGSKIYEEPEIIESAKKLIKEYKFELPTILDCINVQTTMNYSLSPSLSAELVDFGQYDFSSEFQNPIVSLVDDKCLNIGGVIKKGDQMWPVLDPETPLKVELLKRKALSNELSEYFGVSGSPMLSPILIEGLKLTKLIQESNVSIANEVTNRIQEFVEGLVPSKN